MVKLFLFQILSCVLDPLLQMCTVSASRLNTIDMAAYLINCIYLMQTTIALYEFTDTRQEMLQAQVHCLVNFNTEIPSVVISYGPDRRLIPSPWKQILLSLHLDTSTVANRNGS